MNLELFDYHLPKQLIAQVPHRERSESRLLVLDRAAGTMAHTQFAGIKDYLRKGDALVVNNTKVFKARLLGERKTGGKVELFLVRPIDDGSEVWKGLIKPARRVKPGENIQFANGGQVTLGEPLGDGYWSLEFSSRTARERIIESCGHVPLPPYIAREDQPSDIRRYQTVYADDNRVGAVAAPTAGFHFTRPLLDDLKNQGVTRVDLTLHVGPGTFRPITADDINQHLVEPELAELSDNAAGVLNRTRADGGRIVAVGTTSVRTLESAVDAQGEFSPLARLVDLYVKPGHQFKAIDCLITNFHLPKSSLLVLVSAFAGRELILEAYQAAIKEGYRFYSYGDAMLIL
jgi:S-adenosylmethionine:tRNA ribosyltransferase-isomerase